jgi:hypothetical protein
MSRERRMLSYGLLGIAMFCLITCFGSFSYEMNSSGPSGRKSLQFSWDCPIHPGFITTRMQKDGTGSFDPFPVFPAGTALWA